MSRRPNFAFAATQALSGGNYGSESSGSNSGYKPTTFSKPFDGFKTTNITGNYNPKPFETAAPNKFSSAATYGSGGISVSAIEKNIKRDIQELDWELETTKKYTPHSKPVDSEATLKPKLFQKKGATNNYEKSEFNNTGETRATVTQTVASSDWDLPETDAWKPSHGKVANTLSIPAKKPTPHTDAGKVSERSAANDWDLGDSGASKANPAKQIAPKKKYAQPYAELMMSMPKLSESRMLRTRLIWS